MKENTVTYTVIGVWLDDIPIVVGVVAGTHEVYGGDEQTFGEGLWGHLGQRVRRRPCRAARQGRDTRKPLTTPLHAGHPVRPAKTGVVARPGTAR
jgi:hypothetical protein